MDIKMPKRIFLDSWVLKRLARGEWPDAEKWLRVQINEMQCSIIVTADHIYDYGDCNAHRPAMQEAHFVDTLRPLWMLPGEGICRREAFSEYLKLTDRKALPPPFPETTFYAAALQWLIDCRCKPEIRSRYMARAQENCDSTFSGKLRSSFTGDSEWLQPLRDGRITFKQKFNSTRESVRKHGYSEDKFEDRYRENWIRCLTDPPAEPPQEDLTELAEKVDFARMPAWTVRMAVDRTWHKNQTKPKPGDLVDTWHLSLLPYVDVYVTEKNLAGMIKQAGLKPEALVFSNIYDWQKATS